MDRSLKIAEIIWYGKEGRAGAKLKSGGAHPPRVGSIPTFGTILFPANSCIPRLPSILAYHPKCGNCQPFANI